MAHMLLAWICKFYSANFQIDFFLKGEGFFFSEAALGLVTAIWTRFG